MRLRRIALLLVFVGAILAAPKAQAQFAATWLRDALTPPTPGLHKTPSPAIFPPQTIGLTFSHAMHIQAGADCTTCHDSIDKSATSAPSDIPQHVQCETCHDIEAAKRGEKTDPPSSCQTCHPGITTPAQPVPKDLFLTGNINFSHQSHLARGAKCVDCHGEVNKTELATRDNFPRMKTCLTCHDGNKAPNKCSECHVTEPDGVMRTHFVSGTLAPSGTLLDDDHDRDFLKRHAFVAQKNPDSCNNCHRPQECEACHTNTSKAFRYHPPSWIQSHPVTVRNGSMDCTACHREQSFCISCHQTSGVSQVAGLRGPNGIVGLKKFHPPGFATPTVTSANHHSFEAMANPESCVACHREQDCIKCHGTTNVVKSMGGNPVGIDPHPPGFAQSAAACRAFHMTPFACAKCHGGGSGLAQVQSLLVNCR